MMWASLSGVLISGPEQYGLTAEQTLAHRAAGVAPAGFDAFWSDVREETALLPQRWRGAIEPGVNEVVINSSRSVRVIARVTCPPEPIRGVVVTTHGSGAPDGFADEPEPWTSRGMATVRLRVRGYPPSTMDIDDLRSEWILHGIESADAWILRGAIIDVMQAFRCAGRHFEGVPVALHGESLGGGLAVIAAAQLTAMGCAPLRMAIGLPTFGDWRWRRDRYCNGSGALVNEKFRMLREDAHKLMDALLLFDAVHHAPLVVCPTLCKLACADDVVPAPAAAAVFNALGGTPWRFVTRYGHFEGGIEDLRRHVLFERLQAMFLDPGENIDRLMKEHEISPPM